MAECDAVRPAQLNAVSQVLTLLGVGAPLLIVAPLHYLWLGPEALISMSVAVLCGVVRCERILAKWDRIPFTCTYMPGKGPVMRTLLSATVSCLLFVVVGAGLVGVSIADGRLAVGVVTALSVVVWACRTERAKTWGKLALAFEDALPEVPVGILLHAESTTSSGLARNSAGGVTSAAAP
jgi:hypothetical protein